MSHFTALVKGGKLSERVRPRYIKATAGFQWPIASGELTTFAINQQQAILAGSDYRPESGVTARLRWP
jgi:hypothetical protein